MTKSEKLIDAVGFLDDDLIEEAERIRFNKSLRRTYSKPMRFAALAACCAMLIFGAFLFPRRKVIDFLLTICPGHFTL